MFPSAALGMPHIKSGRMRALAITSARPSALAPELPTVSESGLPGFESEAMFGVLAPAKTPAAIIDMLNREMIKVLGNQDVKEKLLLSGSEVVGNNSQAFAEIIKADMAKWSKVIKESGISPE